MPTKPPADTPMPLIEHLRELRKRLLIIISVVATVFLVAWAFSEYILILLQKPLIPFQTKLHFDTLTDPFITHLKAAFLAAILLTFPFLLLQIWLFVKPALFKKETRTIWPFVLLSYPFFVGGALFCYLVVLPQAINFLVQFDENLIPSLRVGDFLSFSSRLLFVFGLVFELPLISLLLTRAKLITPRWLAKNRRYALVLTFIVAAILTPPDAITQLLLALPLAILYEFSILVSWLAKPRKKKVKTTRKNAPARTRT